PDLDGRAGPGRGLDRERRDLAVLARETPLDISQPNAPRFAVLERGGRGADAGVLHREAEQWAAHSVLDACRDRHVAATLPRRDAVLDGVLDDRLQDKRRNADVPKMRRHL